MPNTPKDHDPEGAPVREHLHDDEKRPLKAPVGGIPPNIANQFPSKGGKNFGHAQPNKGRNFRHQGR